MAEREESDTCDEDCNEGGIDNSERTYDEVYNYLTDSQYPKQATKADKAQSGSGQKEVSGSGCYRYVGLVAKPKSFKKVGMHFLYLVLMISNNSCINFSILTVSFTFIVYFLL